MRRSLFRLLSFVRPGRAEAELAREIESHLQLIEDTFVSQGMTHADARLAAKSVFGGIEQAKEHQRDARSFRWLDGSWLDFKLGVRMLVRYPALTVLSGAAIAFGIGAGVGAFELWTQLLAPVLPLEEGSRIVGLRNWDASLNRPGVSTAQDFSAWRDDLTLVEDVSAFAVFSRNLIANDGRSEVEDVAAMSASAFRVVRVPPLLGRTILDSNENPGAPPIVVIGHSGSPPIPASSGRPFVWAVSRPPSWA
jgi:hypothetical protein